MTPERIERPKSKTKPCAIVDWKLVDEMLEQGCYGTHIADRIGICADTLYRACEREKNMTFVAYSQQKKSNGDSCIQQAQYKLAVEQQNATMLIWLGKTRLGQRDNSQENTVTPEQLAKFAEIMNFLAKGQASALNSAESNISNEDKS